MSYVSINFLPCCSKLDTKITTLMFVLFQIKMILCHVLMIFKINFQCLDNSEINLFKHFEKIDEKLSNYLHFRTIKRLSENKLFLFIMFELCLNISLRIFNIYRWQNVVLTGYLFVWNFFDISMHFYLFKIKLFIVLLVIRLESHRSVIYEIIFTQKMSNDMKPIRYLCTDYSKTVVIARLKASKLIFEEIINFAREFSETFGEILFATIFYFFLEIVENLYWLFYTITRSSESLTWDIIARLIPTSITLITVTFAASRVTENVNSFHILLSNLVLIDGFNLGQ